MAADASTFQQSPTSARLLEQFKTTAVFWQQFEIARELAKVGDGQTLVALFKAFAAREEKWARC